MGVNTGKGYRQGAVRERTQFQRPDGQWQKRDETGGRFMEVKQSPGPFKAWPRSLTGETAKTEA